MAKKKQQKKTFLDLLKQRSTSEKLLSSLLSSLHLGSVSLKFISTAQHLDWSTDVFQKNALKIQSYSEFVVQLQSLKVQTE